MTTSSFTTNAKDMDVASKSSLRSKTLKQSNQHNKCLESDPSALKAHHHKRKRSPALTTARPFQASYLSKHDYSSQKPLFALYLEVQKQMELEDLSEAEARGRWKSFVGKWYISSAFYILTSLCSSSLASTAYHSSKSLILTSVRNRGELAEGWYDPATLRKAIESSTRTFSSAMIPGIRTSSPNYVHRKKQKLDGSGSSDDEDIGPALPGNQGKNLSKAYRSGPAIPSLLDLELRRGESQVLVTDDSPGQASTEDNITAREALREQRIVNRKKDKERMEELVPRAEAGSKERIIEKKREKAETNRAFASAKAEGGGVAEVPESDLLGDDDGGIEGFKKQKRELERKKNEREIRREEVSRARAEEREERVKQYRAKEEATMKGLVELAKARFG
ncbi:hypothetical protein MMC18_002012 [Xylographa bjoerkii]|nr:hypothetical protein [Xylographa bjoerkii]